ncbi:aspartic peptidase domain-containing protein [Mycena sp. CBHHK59/15]|nr:aspartic peptidase domain-containing protein [Mycena sp. CBHHK59/15]
MGPPPSSSSEPLTFPISLELTIPLLDHAGELSDAQWAGIRFPGKYSENQKGSITQPVQRNSDVGSLPTTRITGAHTTSRFDTITTLSPMSMAVPVHVSDSGPAPALARKDRTRDTWLTTLMSTYSLGTYRQVVAHLTIGNFERERDQSTTYPVELDLGSNVFWINGDQLLQSNNPRHPKGWGGVDPKFWRYYKDSTNSPLDTEVHKLRYADEGIVEFRTGGDYIKLLPDKPPSDNPPYKSWRFMKFGVAHVLSNNFEFSPASGILGLGRKTVVSGTMPPTFVQQINGRLATPELTLLLTPVGGRAILGKRPELDSAGDFGPWHVDIPVTTEEHWVVSSIAHKLNGKKYTCMNGSALLDTGAAFFYGDLGFVQNLYDEIPGSFAEELPQNANIIKQDSNKTVRDPSRVKYYFIPVDAKVPSIELDIGGYYLKLENLFSPSGLTYDVDNKSYYLGAIQSKTLMFPNDKHAYSGPDVIGRVALFNMEINMKMPSNKYHTLSWRWKKAIVTGPFMPPGA